MPVKSIIVAIDEKNAIGKDNNLLCHLPSDLKYFKSITNGHTVIMGRKTFESLPNGALPNRRNIVLTRTKDVHYPNCEVCGSIQEAFASCKDEDEVFIIGGASIYEEAIKLADKLYVTYIHHSFEGADAFFPPIDQLQWNEISRIDNQLDDKNLYAYTFIIYEKK